MEILWALTAFILGALHALEPGHGKSVMAAFIVGVGASMRDALILGLTVVFSHTFIIFLMGLVSMYLINYINPEQVHDLMSIIGGGILLAVGAWILKSYFFPHEHKIDTTKGVIAIGLSAGMVPCPAALAVLLLGITSGDITSALTYVIIFSLGLAVSITSLSVLLVKSKSFADKYIKSKDMNKLTLISGIVIILIGLYTLSHPVLEYIFGITI